MGLAILGLAATHFAVYRWSTPTATVNPPQFQRLTFQRGSLSGSRFSADGQTVVYSASWQGRPLEIYTTRLDSPESKPLGLPSATLFAVSSAGELAIGLDPILTLWPFGRLASVPMMGGAPRELAGMATGADWSSDGQRLVVANAFGNQRQLESPPGTAIFEVESGRLTYPRISPDGTLIAVCHNLAVSDTRGQIIVVDQQGESTVLSGIYPDLRGLDWSPDGQEVWFTAKAGGRSSSLHAVALDGTERVLFRGVGDIHLQDISEDGRVLLERYNGRWETAARGPDGAQIQDLSIFEWSLIRDVSRDGKTVLIAETGDAVGEEYATYIRSTDGSPPIRLGIGHAQSLSPSGLWALARSADNTKIFLYPTGAGQPQTIELDGLVRLGDSWLLDDGRALINATFEGSDWRGYILNLETLALNPVTEKGVGVDFPTPDGRFAVILDGQGTRKLTALEDGAEPWEVKGGEPREWPLGWASDGHSMYMMKQDRSYPVRVFLLDTQTGERELALTFEPPDLAGTSYPTSARINPDGTAWAFSYPRIFSELHLVEGLQ